MSDLAMANVEALADGENSGGSGGKSCYSTWKKYPNDDSLAFGDWICQECESYWLLEGRNRSSC